MPWSEIDHHLDEAVGKHCLAEWAQPSLNFPIFVDDPKKGRAWLRTTETPRAKRGSVGELVDFPGHFDGQLMPCRKSLAAIWNANSLSPAITARSSAKSNPATAPWSSFSLVTSRKSHSGSNAVAE